MLGNVDLSVEEFVAIARYGAKVCFSENFCERVNRSRLLIEKFLRENRAIYGVTTGFGDNVQYVISPEDAETLQLNIIRSHACSVGEPSGKRDCPWDYADDAAKYGKRQFWCFY